MDLPRECNFEIKPPIFDNSKYVACASSMFFDANSVKSDNESTSNIFCEVETNQTNDGEDKYDMEALTLFTKKFKRSFKKDTNISLATKLKQCEKEKIDALHELDVLKRKHMNLENDMHSLFETNELLESKVAKLQVELDKANATFKKLNAGSQILDEVLSSQKVASDRGGLGYKAEGSLKSKAREKMIFCKPNSNAPASLVANKAKLPVKEKNVKYARTKPPKVKKQCPVVKIATTKRGEVRCFKSKPTCHNCGVIGHIRPHCTKLHMPCLSCARDKMMRKNVQFVPTCHFCGVKGHIRPNCFKLHGYPKTPPQYFGYGFNRTQRPKFRVIPHEKNTNAMSKHVPKIVEKFEKVKTRPIWVRKLDLRTRIDLPSNPLDDYGSSIKVDHTF
ncbi:hypothetical protein RHGRI_000179 [Rhododendron griersonianum]|uniref:CCHC-type domain-containing protein n=5 Tax=Rhododendron griersonianum TaxID=479676 RepID=A0AAV6LIE9_9ERIC|nr:hypothetical protein RHGRI_000179 [Rhododendron griersonianum]